MSDLETKEPWWCQLCAPCALVWVVVLAAAASNMWLNVHWTYAIPAALVIIILIGVYVHQQGEDLWWAASNLLADIWWLFRNRPEKLSRRAPERLASPTGDEWSR